MTLKEAKQKVYSLLDEYSANGEVVIDEDIKLRLNSLFDMCQKNLASLAPIRKLVTVPAGEWKKGVKVIKYLAAFDMQGKRIYPQMIGETLIIPEGGARLDLLTLPENITDETPDTYEFEIKEALQECMPYWVSASLNVVDLVVNPSNLMSQFNTMASAAVSASSPYSGTVSVI